MRKTLPKGDALTGRRLLKLNLRLVQKVDYPDFLGMCECPQPD